MLRRRILASAMASVMAIGSVAVVASAEDTAAATKNAKTKADLKTYVEAQDTYRNDKIYDYGSVSGKKFLDALEYADNVLADSESTDDDATVAYAMIEATKARLKLHTQEELKALLKDAKGDYESNNVLNEELGDNKWTPTSFDTFVEKYDAAEAVVDSSDSRIITDAYEELEAAYGALTELEQVTKSEFRNALKAYETALQKEYAYDTWRRGSDSEKSSIAYGVAYDIAIFNKTTINEKYAILDAIKTLNKTSQTDIVDAYKACKKATDRLNSFKADDTNRATKANVKALLKDYNGRLVYNYATTAANKLYESVLEATEENVTVKQTDNNGITSTYEKVSTVKDDPWYVVTGAKDKLMDVQLTVKAGQSFYLGLDKNGYALGASLTNKVGGAKTETLTVGGQEQTFTLYTLEEDVTYASDPSWTTATAKAGTVVGALSNGETYVLDAIKANGNVWCGHVIDASYSVRNISGIKATVVTTGGVEGAVSYKLVSKGSTVDLTDYIEIDPADVIAKYSEVNNHDKNDTVDDDVVTNSEGDTNAAYATLDVAYNLAVNYINGTYDAADIKDIDTIGQIAENTTRGSSAEWTLVHRYLKYALTDKYVDGKNTGKTREDVKTLIDKCYDLAEATGDAALFTYNHNELVKARQDALAWVKASEKVKTYRDNAVSVNVDGKLINGDLSSNDVYTKLEGYYNTLNTEYANFKYSFGDIAKTIADTKSNLDDETLTLTDDLKAALEETAYYLSTVESLTATVDGADVTLADNDAFTSDRYFQSYNRVFTKGDTFDSLSLSDGKKAKILKNASHNSLKTAYEKLLIEIKSQTEVKTLLGDVNGDGVVNALDAAAILKAAVAGTTIDVKVGDYNADGVVNALDASAILKAATQA